MRLFFKFLILVFCMQQAAVCAANDEGRENVEKEVLLRNWVRVLAEEKVRNIALFDRSMREDFVDQEKGVGYGHLGAGRQLIKSVNKSEKAFVVIIPSYNNSEYYKLNLDSVFAQNYHNFRVIYVDDASPDQTGPLVKQYIRERGQEDRVKFIQNAKRQGALANTYKAAWLCNPDEIIAILDGDDWFAHENVLQKLNSVYADPDVWVTYGQFVYYPCGSPGWAEQVPQYVIDQNSFREYSWVTTALRTFYAGLFHKINKKDLLYNGDFFKMSGDLAYMWPVVEMAGQHSRFISEVLYVYNVVTPINDIKKDPIWQRDLGFVIRERPRYLPVTKPY